MLILFKAVGLIGWVVVGLLTLLSGEISRTAYACPWVVAVMYMFFDIMSA